MGEYRHTDPHTLTTLTPLVTYNCADFSTNVPKACSLVQQPTPSFFTMHQKKTTTSPLKQASDHSCAFHVPFYYSRLCSLQRYDPQHATNSGGWWQKYDGKN